MLMLGKNSSIFTVENFLLVQNFTELLVNPSKEIFMVLIFVVFSLSAKNAKFCTYTYAHDAKVHSHQAEWLV